MKKVIAVLIALMLSLTCTAFSAVFAENDAGETQAGMTTERAYSYDETVKHTPSVWLNTFDPDGACTGTDYVVFNCAAPIKAIGLPELYAGRSENLADCDVRFELFKWDTDAEKTLAGTPAMKTELHFDGDSKELPYFPLESALPAGQYLFRITQLTGQGEDGESPYSVLPISEAKYSESKLMFDARGPFVFFLDCEKTEGITDYFLTLEGAGSEMEIQPEKTILARGSGGAHPLFEYGIVTPVIPDGQVLYSLSLVEAPTWVNKNGDSDVLYEVYKWTGDYDSTLLGRILYSGEILNHADNSNLTMKFGTSMRYGNRYLILVLRSNNGAIGYYESVPDIPDGWEFYEAGFELEYGPSMRAAYALVGDLGPEPTEEPTAVPTEAPVTAEPTAAPATEAPVATEPPTNSATNAPEQKDNNGNKGKLNPLAIILPVCGAAIIAAVVIILVNKKKKQK